MREIKFKIYDKELKEYHIEELQDLSEDDYWYDGDTEVWSVLYDCNHEQERFVALQYTGLKDKNGEEIYEGDILKFKMYDGKYENYKIVFRNAEFEAINEEDTNFISTDIWNVYGEVIGNIYENPELLEDKE